MTLGIKPSEVLGGVKRRLGRFLRSRLEARPDAPAQPTFEDDQFFAHLTVPQAGTEAWNGGQGEAAWEAAITYFRWRVPPLGFLSPERVPALLADGERRFPTFATIYTRRWRGRASCSTGTDCPIAPNRA